MPPYPEYKLKKIAAAVAALLSATVPLTGQGATAGRVNFAYGPVTAEAPDGEKRPLRRGSLINPGDTIHTSRGRAQVRFTDGAYVSLKPASSFRVDEYRYSGKPDGEERGFFSLLRGGLRTITGLIGRVNNKTYRVSTPAATIGIRGTEYVVAPVAAGGYLFGVAPGSPPIDMFLPDGSAMLIHGGEGLYIDASGNVYFIPDLTLVRFAGGTATDLGTMETYQVGNASTSGGTFSTRLEDGVYDLAYGWHIDGAEGDGAEGGVVLDEDSATFTDMPDRTTLLTETEFFNGGVPNPFYDPPGPGVSPNPSATYSVLDSFDGAELQGAPPPDWIDGKSIADSTPEREDGVGWGRWIYSEPPFIDSLAFHYAVGKTSDFGEEGEDMPNGGAVYTLGHSEADGHRFGATRPTSSDGYEGIVTDGALYADFDSEKVAAELTVDFSRVMPGEVYHVETDPMDINDDASFSGSGDWTTGGSCGGNSCDTDFAGHFVGNPNPAVSNSGAPRAIAGYAIHDTDLGEVAGSAAFITKSAADVDLGIPDPPDPD